jgi:IS1 family transposase
VGFRRLPVVYCADNVAYRTRIVESIVDAGKRNMQRIECKFLSLRTWCSCLVRCGIRFLKFCLMYRVVVGLVINFWFFKRDLSFNLL